MNHHILIFALLFLTLPSHPTCLAAEASAPSEDFDIQPLRGEPECFPVVTQFSPIPSGKGWKAGDEEITAELMRDTVDNIIAHGFTGLETVQEPKRFSKYVLDYAQSRGMIVTHHVGALEGFGRTEPPAPSVYSAEYGQSVRSRAQNALASLKSIPRLYNVFTYQDEPFHWGPKSFGYDQHVKTAFRKLHGYELPNDLESIRNDPTKWLDVINFRSDNFPHGWRQVHQIIKDIDPHFITVLTHDSHNTFGAGYSSHCEIAIDDVFHWGGDFADMFVFDIYPYMMFDFRFGEMARLPKPRMSQLHYSFAQMRNLTTTYDRKLGFWVGTYNPTWFKDYLCDELKAMHWAERETSTTAVAAGADYLLTGYKIPIDARHWDSFGTGLQLIQKAGARLLKTPKVKAKACMLFPRTHYIQMQEEYFNVGVSFELFLRAFGELDVIHEEQVIDDSLGGYDVLVLFDVKLLPKEVAERIASFVNNGGLLVADCVPSLDESKNRLTAMEELFGVENASTGRIKRSGHSAPYQNTHAPVWHYRPEDAPDETVFKSDRLRGEVLGQNVDLPLVSPRPCTVTTGDNLLSTIAGQPGVVHRKAGKGHVYLLGFCLQDTYFKTWQDRNTTARSQLRALLRSMTQASGVQSHVHSSNPDVEAALRANDKEGFLFIINHEATDPDTTVQLTSLEFEIADIVNLADGRPIELRKSQDLVEFRTSVPLGETQVYELRPAENRP